MRLNDFHRRGWKSVGEQESRASILNHRAASDESVTAGE